jgi:hypothetical protein
MDISSILAVIINSGLKIGAINTEEPSLEDVFMHLTRQSGRGEKKGQILRNEPSDRN